MKKVFNIFIIITTILSFTLTPFLSDSLLANPGYLICLDPGHGGRDPGAVGATGLMEKVVNLDIAYKVKSKLRAKGYSIIMTRTSDTYLSLDQRVTIANNKNATIFASIHNNAFTLPTAHGTETYYSSSGAPYGYYLADAIQQRVVANTGSKNRGTKDGGFYVLNHTNMPAALQEGEFLSNPDKEALLKTDAFRNKIAQGVYEGIVNYLNKYGGGQSSGTYGATYSDATKTPASMEINKTYTIPITITNTGTLKWPSTGTNKVNLSYHWYDTAGKMIVRDGKRTNLLSDMAQGAEATLNAQVLAPSKAGTYVLKYDLVHEYVTWFSQRNVPMLSKTVNVVGGTNVISNSTSMRGISSATKDQMLNMFKNHNQNKIDKATRIVDMYINWGNKFNIRADIAWAQMCHETNFLKYDGIVPESANNFCGLGATGAPGVYNTFTTEELGIIAHYAHLAWYVYPNHVNSYCSMDYDPRHFTWGVSPPHNYNGDNTLNSLNGRWAPSPDYTYKIILFANEIYN